MSRFSAYNLARSFCYAISGIIHSLRYERNLRIHFFTAVYILYFSRYYNFSGVEYAILSVSIGLVIVCELINTAIEAAVDLTAHDYNALAKTAKDVAAGAVLVSTCVAIVVGLALLMEPEVLLQIRNDILKTPFVWIFLIAITIFLIAWPEQRQLANGISKKNGFKEIK